MNPDASDDMTGPASPAKPASGAGQGQRKRRSVATSPELPAAAGGSGAAVGAGPPPAIRAGFWPTLDGVLRNREAFYEEILDGRNVGARIRWFLVATLLLTGFYGLTMGLVGFRETFGRGLLQALASGVKVPALYLLSLGVCFPALYIVLVLMGARLRFSQALALLMLTLTLNAVLLASCAPITLFFAITGSGYDFIKLLHVAVFAFSGGWSILALLNGLRSMCERYRVYPRLAIQILQIWALIFGFVGTQMAWSLRPFVGNPTSEFQLFRGDQPGNFYTAVWDSLSKLATRD